MNWKAPLLASLMALAAIASPGVAAARRKAPEIAYPMKADEFRKLIEARIDRVRAAIDKKLDRAGVTPDRKKAIHKTLDEASKEARAEVARATSDGVVTQAEGDKVKSLVAQIRGNVRERLAAERKARARKSKDPPGKDPKRGKDRKGAKDGPGDPKDAKKPVKDEPAPKEDKVVPPAPSAGSDGDAR
jgi:hypothetical protein